MTIRVLLLASVVTAVAATTAGCTPYQTPTEKLGQTVHRYNTAVRWRNYQAAAKHIPDADREAYLSKRRALTDDMRILEFEVGEVRQTEANKVAEVLVHFTWTHRASNVVEHTHFKQTWNYGENKSWALKEQKVVEAPDRKAREVPLSDRF